MLHVFNELSYANMSKYGSKHKIHAWYSYEKKYRNNAISDNNKLEM